MCDILYQTLEDRSNPEEVEQHGPYRCTRSNAWLGSGYYFWHQFIDLAHWWGRNSYPDTYMICRQTGDIDGNPEVLDLYADLVLRDTIREYVSKMKNAYNQKTMTVRTVLEHMKKIGALDDYKAVRIEGVNSTNRDKFLQKQKLKFNPDGGQYYDMIPPIQVCVYDKSVLNDDFQVIYPQAYLI